ncbi:hypothetical protein [Kitasatospora sp. GP82]|uniref:hypothetical protein n=1 Tax=Kitasatospora sp. GP82 TaxID=3035089 RepID=UPI002472FAE1|nr:hypothetical protein [Kitasatospora sp. GP82]MDH6124309.1 hypothetical protein [Kitasatospora sp. GP82]
MTGEAAIGRIHMLAIEWIVDWQWVTADRLVQAAEDALRAGVDTPSLWFLAELGRSENAEARELFGGVLDELGLRPQLPGDRAGARWELAHWWAGQIAEGVLDPALGANLIWREAANELGHPQALQPFVRWASELDDWHEGFAMSRQRILDNIVAAAGDLVGRAPCGGVRPFPQGPHGR